MGLQSTCKQQIRSKTTVKLVQVPGSWCSIGFLSFQATQGPINPLKRGCSTNEALPADQLKLVSARHGCDLLCQRSSIVKLNRVALGRVVGNTTLVELLQPTKPNCACAWRVRDV